MGIDRGLEDTLKTVREVHTTFLKGVTDTPEDIAIPFASSDVAVATVTSTMSPYTRPDGVKQGPQKQVRTFVLVKRGERYRDITPCGVIGYPSAGSLEKGQAIVNLSVEAIVRDCQDFFKS